MLLTITWVFCQTTLSQNGVPYITYLDSREGYEAMNWAVCQDDHNAMLFAGRKGLFRYDGSEWQHVKIPDIPLRIKQNPYNDKVYIISEHNYGYLERDERGIQFYEPLTFDDELDGRLNDILFTDSSIIFYGENNISCHSNTDHQLLYRFAKSKYGPFGGVFTKGQQTYVTIKGRGLSVLNGDTLIPKKIIGWNPDMTILFSIPHNKTELLLGTSENELLLFNGEKLSDFRLSNPEYLRENVLSDGLALNDTTYVFSSKYGGVLIIDKISGKVVYTLNYDSGLPDDEIFAIGKDRNNGLWLTYGFGACRIDLNMEVRDFSHYKGIEGLLTNTVWYQGELYVSSTEGLYYLSEVKNYEEVEVYFKKISELKEEEPQKRRRNRDNTDKTEEKRGLISRLFNRDKPADSIETEEETPAVNDKVKVEYVRKKVSKLMSIEYLFKKVEGLNSRCQQLVLTDYGLLVGSSSGLYLVKDHEKELISDNTNIVYISEQEGTNTYLIISDEGVSILIFEEGDPFITRAKGIAAATPSFSVLISDSVYWVSGLDVVYRTEPFSNDSSFYRSYFFNSVFPEELRLARVNDTLFLFSESAIRFFDPVADTFLTYPSSNPDLMNFSILHYFPSVSGQQWLKADQKMVQLGHTGKNIQDQKWGLFENITTFYSENGKVYWIIDDYSGIYRIGRGPSLYTGNQLEIFLEYVSNEADDYLDLSSLEFQPTEKLVKIKVSAPYFLRSQTTEYQYKVEGKMDLWSSWSKNPNLDILLEPGEYNVQVRAKSLLGDVSVPISVSLKVREPFYHETWFYLCLIPVVLGIFYLFVYAREKKLRRDKRILELKVEERTIEIRKQKQKIEIQKDEILAQKNDITSSITYASRIQNAILPSRQIFEKTFSEYFIFYKPRDIVSGDFYWVTEVKGEIIFAVADCTGHGVPGAFMSMLGNSFLNEITKEGGSGLPSNEILNRLREMINSALSQSGENIKAIDGMDITLCRYNKKNYTLEFSGAFNPLYHVRNNELIEYKTDRMPIGFHPKKRSFTSQTIKLNKGDVIYLFSDGFHDQFGGAFGKKYTTKQFKETLQNISFLGMDDQNRKLEQELSEWQGEREQIDDILIIGIRI